MRRSTATQNEKKNREEGTVGLEYERDEHDRFYTPPALARAFADQAVELFGSARVGTFVEPSVGGGSLVRAFLDSSQATFPGEARVDRLITFDLDAPALFNPAAPAPTNVGFYRHFTDDWVTNSLNNVRADLVLANPPFAARVPKKRGNGTKRKAVIQKHVEAMLESLAEGGLCGVLAAQRFLGKPRDRWLMTSARPFKIQQITPRPSFTPDGKTDMSEYVIVWWEKVEGSCHAPETTFDWLEWQKPKKAKPYSKQSKKSLARRAAAKGA